ncbi:DNA primase [Rhizobium phage vB_RleS_L338C]|uniref:DNA primase n=1 Tax=Rhizobium phage vB_RleS_L338C TaxID=1414737 RepID=UPI0003D8ACF0|nr:DNA primase [Rhizobium phage vB_RleS_L338C]AHC30479.1 DNA primase [Rhizobium phage vB_RleS_L338C]QNH72056.1 DNA primase [Rhizobium phage P11VFA]
MDEAPLRSILARLGIRNFPKPNHAGWGHVACPFARYMPQHKSGVDRSQGFAIKVEKDGPSAFNCPVCKMHGRISNLAMNLGRFHDRDYTEVAYDADMADLDALNYLPAFEAVEVDLPPTPLDDAIFDGMFEEPWKVHNRYPQAVRFLQARGVSQATAEKLGLGYDPEKKRITFPVRGFKGELYGFSGRTIMPDHKPKVLDYENLPKRWLILGVEFWVPGRPIVMVEGLFAYAHFHEIGAAENYNVGALLGSYLTPEKADILKSYDEPVYWFTDPDPAGDDCLFGRVLPGQDQLPEEDDEPGERELLRDRSTSALYALNGHVPQYVPNYPVDDPDDLTVQQFHWMMDNAELWLPDAK